MVKLAQHYIDINGVPLITDLVGFVQAAARELAGPFSLATSMRNSSKQQIEPRLRDEFDGFHSVLSQ